MLCVTSLFYINILCTSLSALPFSAANGIVRTEAVTGLFIQKASTARRVYATIIEVKHRAAGYVPEGWYYPSFM